MPANIGQFVRIKGSNSLERRQPRNAAIDAISRTGNPIIHISERSRPDHIPASSSSGPSNPHTYVAGLRHIPPTHKGFQGPRRVSRGASAERQREFESQDANHPQRTQDKLVVSVIAFGCSILSDRSLLFCP
jgi:hypothetical protein